MIWPVHDFLQTQTGLTDEEKAEMEHRYYKALIRRVEQVAAQEEPDGDLVALDWFNGRRYPMINESVKSVFSGLSLSTTPPQIYAAMAMAAVFGSKRILDTLVTRGLQIDSIITVGGIPKKSPYIMQMMADVLNRPIKVSRAEQCCAPRSRPGSIRIFWKRASTCPRALNGASSRSLKTTSGMKICTEHI